MGSTYILVLLTQRFLRANNPNPAPSRVLKDRLHPAQGNPGLTTLLGLRNGLLPLLLLLLLLQPGR